MDVGGILASGILDKGVEYLIVWTEQKFSERKWNNFLKRDAKEIKYLIKGMYCSAIFAYLCDAQGGSAWYHLQTSPIALRDNAGDIGSVCWA